MYKKHTFIFNEGVTCLIGKNGSGKSTLLRILKEYFDKEKIKYFYYNNEDSEKHAMESFSFYGELEKIARNYQSSEGQNIRNNFEDILPKMGNYIRTLVKRKQDKAIILLDGLDSGISLDYVIKLKKELFPCIIEDCKKDNITPYIIITANNYEFCNKEDSVRVSDAKHFCFKDYKEFRKIYIR